MEDFPCVPPSVNDASGNRRLAGFVRYLLLCGPSSENVLAASECSICLWRAVGDEAAVAIAEACHARSCLCRFAGQ